MTVRFVVTGLAWRAVRHHYQADIGTALYVIERPRTRYHGWQALVGRRDTRVTVELGDWPSFAAAQAACELDLIREQTC